jgi:DNA-damage-inducible protein J
LILSLWRKNSHFSDSYGVDSLTARRGWHKSKPFNRQARYTEGVGLTATPPGWPSSSGREWRSDPTPSEGSNTEFYNRRKQQMARQTSMLHVRVDDKLKTAAAEKLANFGMTVSDAVRILLTRVVKEGALPAGLTADPEAYEAWFRAKVREALADERPALPHEQVMHDAQALIDRKHRARN